MPSSLGVCVCVSWCPVRGLSADCARWNIINQLIGVDGNLPAAALSLSLSLAGSVELETIPPSTKYKL